MPARTQKLLGVGNPPLHGLQPVIESLTEAFHPTTLIQIVLWTLLKNDRHNFHCLALLAKKLFLTCEKASKIVLLLKVVKNESKALRKWQR